MTQFTLSADKLDIGYNEGSRGQHIVHRNLNLTVPKGTLVTLLGPNGAGKSTLLRTLAGSQPPLSGCVYLRGEDLYSFNIKERSQSIALVLTDRTLSGGLTLRELVSLGRQPYTGLFGRLSKEDKAIVQQALKDVGMHHLQDRYVAELSDGERQKGLIAKALVQEADLIILDEPTAFLDVVSRIEIVQLLRRLANNKGCSVLLSSHDVEQALMQSDYLWLLTADKGLQHGFTEDMVLSGMMEGLFPRSPMVFDAVRGTYLPPIERQNVCLLTGNDGLRIQWCENLLIRHGVSTVYSTGDVETLNEKTLYLGHITVNSDVPIMYESIKGERVECSTFQALAHQMMMKGLGD